MFKIILYIDPKKLIGLSATMISDDPKINYMYELLYPVRDRASNLVEYVKYINVKTYGYRLEKFRLVYKTSMGYNHILFEKSIMQNAKALKDYVEMVLYYIEHEYLKYKKDSDKCLLFFASVDMCTLMTRQVKLKYPKLVVKRYVEKDPYENVLTADVCVSTNKSAGTAVDIPKLITTIQTVSISGTQPNKQSAGRLREIDDKEVRYICLYSTDLKIHVKMNAKRYKALIDIFKTYSSDGYRKVIGRPFEK